MVLPDCRCHEEMSTHFWSEKHVQESKRPLSHPTSDTEMLWVMGDATSHWPERNSPVWWRYCLQKLSHHWRIHQELNISSWLFDRHLVYLFDIQHNMFQIVCWLSSIGMRETARTVPIWSRYSYVVDHRLYNVWRTLAECRWHRQQGRCLSEWDSSSRIKSVLAYGPGTLIWYYEMCTYCHLSLLVLSCHQMFWQPNDTHIRSFSICGKNRSVMRITNTALPYGLQRYLVGKNKHLTIFDVV